MWLRKLVRAHAGGAAWRGGVRTVGRSGVCARGGVGSEARGRHRRPLADGPRPRLRPDRLVLVEHHSWSCVAGRHSSDAVLSNRLHVMQI